MEAIEIFGIIAGTASVIGLFTFTYKKVIKSRNDDSVKNNKQVIKNGSNNTQAGRDINDGAK